MVERSGLGRIPTRESRATLGQQEAGACRPTLIRLCFMLSATHLSGAVVCLRVEASSGSARVSLVAAKTRVAPIKQLNLLKLERMGVLAAARLICFVQESLQLDIRSIPCWSGSELTLAWVRSADSWWSQRAGDIVRKEDPADLMSGRASL
ncbi:hypothetical protein T4D_8611 [Trichinella pseudospiralis]|uniref:Uncharacterized protein n=1 Tax=Trichinella pseudospiralis TaxID=6337 RepID=A0A0V1F8C1_TRIPS|nr:hypothetical protein T4D_8611 [Trichinella pseudospiralis]